VVPQSVPLGVTGASGRLGGRIARLLAAAGVEQRLVLRTPSRAPSLPRVEVAQAAYRDHDAVRRALEGLDVVLMVSGAESEDRVDEHRTFVDAAADAGVRHLVYISFFAAAPDATFLLARDHHVTEQHVEHSGMTWTFLRDNLYADFMTALIGDDGVIRGPAGTGRVAAVAQDDIADVATAVLLDPTAHAGATYSLTGPQALSLHEVAAVLTTELHRPVTYQPETIEQAYASRAGYGAPRWQLDAWVSTYTAIAAGEVAEVTDDIPQLTGRPATALADLLRRGGSAY